MRLRVVTYNIRLGIQEGVEAIADALADEELDVVALQEVGRNWIMGPQGDTTARLAALLGLHHFVFVPSLTRGAAHYGHALLSRWPFVNASFCRLAQREDEPRTVLDSQLESPGGLVRVLSTHLSHIEDRPPQMEALYHRVRTAPDIPTLLTGDLNETSDPFLDEMLATYADADPSARPTFPASGPQRRIDYVIARDGALTDTVVGANATASDHLYVATTWNL